MFDARFDGAGHALAQDPLSSNTFKRPLENELSCWLRCDSYVDAPYGKGFLSGWF